MVLYKKMRSMLVLLPGEWNKQLRSKILKPIIIFGLSMRVCFLWIILRSFGSNL